MSMKKAPAIEARASSPRVFPHGRLCASDVGGRPETVVRGECPNQSGCVCPSVVAASVPACGCGIGNRVARAYKTVPRCRRRVRRREPRMAAGRSRATGLDRCWRSSLASPPLPRAGCSARALRLCSPRRLRSSANSRCRRNLGPQQGRQRHLRGVEAVRHGPLPRGRRQSRRQPRRARSSPRLPAATGCSRPWASTTSTPTPTAA